MTSEDDLEQDLLLCHCCVSPDDGKQHARAAGNQVRDRRGGLWRPPGIRIHNSTAASELSVGESLNLLQRASDQKNGLFCSIVKQGKTAAAEKVICL